MTLQVANSHGLAGFARSLKGLSRGVGSGIYRKVVSGPLGALSTTQPSGSECQGFREVRPHKS